MPAPRAVFALFVKAAFPTLVLASVPACQTSPPEESITADPSKASPTKAAPAANPVATNDFKVATSTPVSPGDPLGGKWSLADATKGISGTGALLATIDTNHGKIACKLYEDKAPNTVANFVGLATGKRTWKNPAGQWVNTPAYDGTTFHRIIKDFMIQGGDAAGTGAGEPGYVINDEMWDGGKHDRAGLLCMANRGKNTNGAQFFITESGGPTVTQLDHYGTYTIFGECTPLDLVHEIAGVPTTHPGDKPLTPVTINKVTVAREKPAK